MSRFKDVLNNIPAKRPVDNVNIVDNFKTEPEKITDPRPDLTEDSALWTTFLTLAARESRQLYGVLHGFRCAGTRLVRADSGKLAGMYILRPDIDPTGDRAWESRELYEEFEKKYLKPLEPQLLKVLGELNRHVKKSKAS